MLTPGDSQARLKLVGYVTRPLLMATATTWWSGWLWPAGDMTVGSDQQAGRTEAAAAGMAQSTYYTHSARSMC
jgi:hypothetical protein